MVRGNDRREFFRRVGAFGLGAASLPLATESDAEAAPGGRSRVAVVTNQKAVSNRNVVDRGEARRMIDRALQIVTGKTVAKDAWAALGVTGADVVGIKVNCNTWTFLLHTHPELVYALCDSLSAVVPANNLIIYERYSSELSRSGYTVNTGARGVRCFGNDDGPGFRGEVTRIVTDLCTKIINVPTLKGVEGDFAGSLFLKNHIGSIPVEHMTNCHGNADYCTEVCSRASIRNKTVLALCDGLRGTWKRGTPWYWGGIIMSRDQIAAECTALSVIDEKRTREGERALGIPGYVRRAGTAGLGTADPSRIEVVRAAL